jgi:hypothetical protein
MHFPHALNLLCLAHGTWVPLCFHHSSCKDVNRDHFRNTLSAFHTSPTLVILLVALLTSPPVMRREEKLSMFSVLQRMYLPVLVPDFTYRPTFYKYINTFRERNLIPSSGKKYLVAITTPDNPWRQRQYVPPNSCNCLQFHTVLQLRRATWSILRIHAWFLMFCLT